MVEPFAVDPMEEFRQQVIAQAQLDARAQVAAQLANAQALVHDLETKVTAARKVKTPAFFSGSGKKDEPTLRNWRSSMEVYLRAAKATSVREQLEVAGACLSGTAVDWFNTVFWPNMGPETTWADFIAALQTRFEPVDSEITARAKLNTLRQGKYSVTAYSNMFTDLIGRVGAMEEKDRYEHFVVGLRKEIGDPLRLNMVGRQLQLAVAMAVAFEIESALSRNANQPKGAWHRQDQFRRGGFNRFNMNGNANANANVPLNDGPVPMELGHMRLNHDDEDDEKYQESDNTDDNTDDVKTPRSYALAAMQQHAQMPKRGRLPLPKLSDAERAKLRAAGSCFRCRRPGHIARDCPAQYQANGPKA
jgi:hypothetical protein